MLFITILLLEILSSAEIDLFVPSFPDLLTSFQLSVFQVELLLGLNLGAHCITAIIVGNLGDKYGRKPVIILGLIIFIIGSIFCTFATSYWHLILGRILQGIGISGPTVLSYLIIADMYSIERQQYLMGILNGVITLGMAFAPVAGSYVDMLFGWQGNFALLLIFGVVCLVLSLLCLPKAAPNPEINISVKEYIPIFTSRKAVYYIITLGFLLQSYWIFIGISPILYMEDLNVPIELFGFYQGTIAAAFSVVSLGSGYLLQKFGAKNCFFFSLYSLGVFVILTILLIVMQINNPLIITLVMTIQAMSITLPINILWPLSLQALPNAKARLTAVFVSSRLIITAVNIQLVSYFYGGTFLPLGIAMCLTMLIAFIACYKLFQEEQFFSSSPASSTPA